MAESSMAEPSSVEDRSLTAALRQVLIEHGVVEPGSSHHGWRCEYPERYGACTCTEELLADLVKAVRPDAEDDLAVRAVRGRDAAHAALHIHPHTIGEDCDECVRLDMEIDGYDPRGEQQQGIEARREGVWDYIPHLEQVARHANLTEGDILNAFEVIEDASRWAERTYPNEQGEGT